MTGSRILLDTNIIIELFKGNPFVTDFLSKQEAFNIPPPVLGELYLGAYRSANPIKHIKQINDFLTQCSIIPIDHKTSNEYALIKASLLKKGKPIPENDIWIAATAKQYNLIVHTRDKHFEEIDEIEIKMHVNTVE